MVAAAVASSASEENAKNIGTAANAESSSGAVAAKSRNGKVVGGISKQMTVPVLNLAGLIPPGNAPG